jgi:hypothetical protein
LVVLLRATNTVSEIANVRSRSLVLFWPKLFTGQVIFENEHEVALDCGRGDGRNPGYGVESYIHHDGDGRGYGDKADKYGNGVGCGDAGLLNGNGTGDGPYREE